MDKFNIGDRVRVISHCNSYFEMGKVMGYVEYPDYYSCKYVMVKLDRGALRSYNEKSLLLLSKGDYNMSIKGNYQVAMVKFLEGTNTLKGYAFALFDDDIYLGDTVLCDTQRGMTVGKVESVLPKEDYNDVTITREIICKVDFSNFENRKAARKKMDSIKKKMDKMVRENQELVLYKMLAENNPEMATMLNEFKELSESV